jgi:Restriction endonuclease
MFGRSSGINPKYDDPSNHDGKYPPDWDARRKAVYERDNYTCQDCGLRSGPHAGDGGAILHAHHLISLRDGGRHHLANLVTVCQYCHDGIHGHPTGSSTMRRTQCPAGSPSSRQSGSPHSQACDSVVMGG